MSRPAALFTGASRGGAEEVARLLAAAGHDLTISARGIEPLEELAAEFRDQHGVVVEPVRIDMSSADDVLELAARHHEVHGWADVVVLNAGRGIIGPFAEFPVRKLDLMLTIKRAPPTSSLRSRSRCWEAGRTTELGGKVIAVASTTGPRASLLGVRRHQGRTDLVVRDRHDGGVAGRCRSPGLSAPATRAPP